MYPFPAGRKPRVEFFFGSSTSIRNCVFPVAFPERAVACQTGRTVFEEDSLVPAVRSIALGKGDKSVMQYFPTLLDVYGSARKVGRLDIGAAENPKSLGFAIIAK